MRAGFSLDPQPGGKDLGCCGLQVLLTESILLKAILFVFAVAEGLSKCLHLARADYHRQIHRKDLTRRHLYFVLTTSWGLAWIAEVEEVFLKTSVTCNCSGCVADPPGPYMDLPPGSPQALFPTSLSRVLLADLDTEIYRKCDWENERERVLCSLEPV